MSGEETIPARDRMEEHSCKYVENPCQVILWTEGYGIEEKISNRST
jgi:hypothetical protein